MTIKKQLQKVLTQIVNLLQNFLGDDYLSASCRLLLLKLLGNKFGTKNIILGGSSFNGGRLKTGDNVFINRACFFDFTGKVYLGSGVSVAHGVTFTTAHHEIGPPEKRAGKITPKDIRVGNGAWIGANATIMPGVTIGNGAIVGANSLVTKSVPPNAVYAGVPAKHLKILDDGQTKDIQSLHMSKSGVSSPK